MKFEQVVLKEYTSNLHVFFRKIGNTAKSMGSKSPKVITNMNHSANVDHKFNAKPRPFGVPGSSSSIVQVKPTS